MQDNRILVVDGDADFREATVGGLKKRGLKAEGAGSGEAALEMIAARAFDVIILNLKTSGPDGIATLREIKRNRPLSEVILLTGHGSADAGIEGMQLGAFDCMVKSSNFDALLEKIQQACDKKAAGDKKIRQAILRDLSAHPSHVPGVLKKGIS